MDLDVTDALQQSEPAPKTGWLMRRRWAGGGDGDYRVLSGRGDGGDRLWVKKEQKEERLWVERNGKAGMSGRMDG